MAANTNPIFTLTPNIGFGTAISAAANDFTGVSVNYVAAFTAGANGSYIERIRCKPVGTNSQSAAFRIFINNGATHATAGNNTFYGEISLPIIAIVATGANAELDYWMNIAIPAGYVIYIGLSQAVDTGWMPTVIGGDY